MLGRDSRAQNPLMDNTELQTSPPPSEGCHGTHLLTSQVGQPTCAEPLCVQIHTTMLLRNRMQGLLQNHETTLFCRSQGQNDFMEDINFECLLERPLGNNTAQSRVGFPTSINKTIPQRYSYKTTQSI